MDALRVYYDFGYKAVQIRLEDELTDAEWETYRQATHVEGIDYKGSDRSQVAPAFVDGLPPLHACGDTCAGCDGTLRPSRVVVDDVTVTLCATCQKDYWGVSS